MHLRLTRCLEGSPVAHLGSNDFRVATRPGRTIIPLLCAVDRCVSTFMCSVDLLIKREVRVSKTCTQVSNAYLDTATMIFDDQDRERGTRQFLRGSAQT